MRHSTASNIPTTPNPVAMDDQRHNHRQSALSWLHVHDERQATDSWRVSLGLGWVALAATARLL